MRWARLCHPCSCSTDPHCHTDLLTSEVAHQSGWPLLIYFLRGTSIFMTCCCLSVTQKGPLSVLQWRENMHILLTNSRFRESGVWFLLLFGAFRSKMNHGLPDKAVILNYWSVGSQASGCCDKTFRRKHLSMDFGGFHGSIHFWMV